MNKMMKEKNNGYNERKKVFMLSIGWLIAYTAFWLVDFVTKIRAEFLGLQRPVQLGSVWYFVVIIIYLVFFCPMALIIQSKAKKAGIKWLMIIARILFGLTLFANCGSLLAFLLTE